MKSKINPELNSGQKSKIKNRKSKMLWFLVVLIGCFQACREGERYGVSITETEAPDAPVVYGTRSLDGGVRFYYTVPKNKDVIAVKGEYVNEAGKLLHFSSSYFKDSLDVLGFADTIYYDVKIYAVNRAGRRSKENVYPVKPERSVLNMVMDAIVVKPSFGSLFVEWENELKWNVNVFVNFKFKQQGKDRDLWEVFTSNKESERGIIYDLTDVDNNEVDVSVYVEDSYNNRTETIPFGTKTVLQDIKIPKFDEEGNKLWNMPVPNDSVAGIPQFWGYFGEGRNEYVIDDIIDYGNLLNFCHTNNRGRTGKTINGNIWNVLIDLGDYYEISRIVTHQRQFHGTYILYGGPNRNDHHNVGHFAMYVLNEEVSPPEWELIRDHFIPIPKGVNDLEIYRLGNAGDMAFLYPDDPKFSRPTRWFRYEALNAFPTYTINNFVYPYYYTDHTCLSEITIYGRKAEQ